MFLSVAICTWNRSALLRQTLEQFRALQIPPGIHWELLVVNNNCTDDTSRVLAEFAGCLPLLELTESRRGHSHARNRALEAARGKYILWTDDDVLVHPDWLTAYVEAIRCWPQAVYFGGAITPLFEMQPPAWIMRSLDLLEGTFALRDFGPETRPLRPGELPFGANMAFRADVLRQTRFDGRLGRQGRVLLSGDETQLFRRLQANGQLGLWVGKARVRHHIPAQRMTLTYLWKFFQGSGRTFVRQGDNPPGRAWRGVPRWAVRQGVTAAARALLFSPFRSRLWVAAIRDTAKALGTIQEARAQFLARQRGCPGVADS
jgi:glycosyltransferase involved in cell wall biosynthesis